MTARQIKARVDFWTKRLAPLGLSHWDFEVYVFDGDIEDSPGCDATADTSDQYDSARLSFRADKVDRDVREVDQLVLHELIHVAMRDFDETVDLVGWQLSIPVKSVWEQITDREREGLVERLARTIWSMHYE